MRISSPGTSLTTTSCFGFSRWTITGSSPSTGVSSAGLSKSRIEARA